MKKSAFTLVELMVVITILAILVAIIVPVVTTAIRTGRETACRSNLKVLGDALHQYAQDYKRLPGIESETDNWYAIGHKNNDPSNAMMYDGTRPLFMLMWVPDGAGGRTEVDYISPKAFICPSVASAVEDPMAYDNQVGFTSPDSITYSYQHQHQVATNGFSLSRMGNAAQVILADRNPMLHHVDGNTGFVSGTTFYRMNSSGLPATSNSQNHSGRGQNVLALGGSVKWTTSPVVGLGNDNIWIPTGYAGLYPDPDRNKAPADKDDVLLLP